jgi:hypothetical protein
VNTALPVAPTSRLPCKQPSATCDKRTPSTRWCRSIVGYLLPDRYLSASGGWSVKLEYLYIDLGDTERTLATPALGTILTDTRRTTDNIVRVGLNYRWGGYGVGY